jgi:hydrogenase nickel incorporation protein HypB
MTPPEATMPPHSTAEMLTDSRSNPARAGQPRILQVRTQILKNNDVLARSMRERFRSAGVFVVSLVSSPGAGKTTFLRDTLRRLRAGGNRVAALVGDLATENDARRLAESGAPVRQIVTGTVCHLEADMVERALGDWRLDALDYLFVENVGNLVCPASYDLGEDLRLVLLSTTEGEDKPLKYPTIFNTADAAVVTKADLAAAVEFDRAAALANINEVRPGLPVLEVSAKTGEGMDAWMADLARRRQGRPTPTGGVLTAGQADGPAAVATGGSHAL